MAKPNPSYLKLLADPASRPNPPGLEQVPGLESLLEAFRLTTGWSLSYESESDDRDTRLSPWSASVAGQSALAGHLNLEAASDSTASNIPRVEAGRAKTLASSLANLLGENLRLQRALWQREAELAAGVPVVSAPDDQSHLAARLQSVLKAGADSLGCQAAALYLLDEGTTQLKLRACWGLPLERLAEPARELRGAMADLEALLGHAVVLEDDALMDAFHVPEPSRAAVCVPVSTATTILGTLWVFCDHQRKFSDRQTNILEVTAGRLAADLEREMLLHEGVDAVRIKRQYAEFEQTQRDQLPSVSPHIAGWDLAGWSHSSERMARGFFDWFSLPDGEIAGVVAEADAPSLTGAMLATSAKTALRCHAQHLIEPERVLTEVGRTLWTASAGDQRVSACYGVVSACNACVRLGVAGPVTVLRVDQLGWKSLVTPSPRLGEDVSNPFVFQTVELTPGQLLVIFTAGLTESMQASGQPYAPADLVQALSQHWHRPARQLIGLIQAHWQRLTAGRNAHDTTLLVVKRVAP